MANGVEEKTKVASGEYWDAYETEFGFYIMGEIPIDAWLKISKQAQKKGFDRMDLQIAQVLHANVVFTNELGSIAWQKNLNMYLHNPDYLKSGDVGQSSLAIYNVMNNYAGSEDAFHFPRDPDDFGRCYRLLRRNPEWLAQIGKVGELSPPWKRLTDRWEELTKLFEEEGELDETGHPTVKTMPRMYDLMQTLVIDE